MIAAKNHDPIEVSRTGVFGRRSVATHHGWALFGAVAFATLVGCGRIENDYGVSSGRVGRTSLNGFGALRETFEQSGFVTRDVNRLSDRTLRHDVIVWTPQTFDSIPTEASRWFERWLELGGKTLVYVVPDSGSEADYWIEAGQLADPAQRLEYRRRAARSVNERIVWRLNRGSISSNGWFRVEALEEREPIGTPRGSWVRGESLPAADSASTEYQVLPYEPAGAANAATSTTTTSGTAPAPPTQPTARTGPTGPSTPAWNLPKETKVTSTKTEFRPVLKNGAGEAVVAQITAQEWKDSQVLVVAGGGLLTNFAFTRPFSRRLAGRLVAAASNAPSTSNGSDEAGFLTTGWEGVRVSEAQAGVPKATGMELLTVWPLSLVTMHALMLGLVVCLMLLPIFGRPTQVRYRQLGHFGDHLDAVAALMSKTDGEAYARRRISEYLRRVRGETSGPWVLPEPAASTTTKAAASTPPTEKNSENPHEDSA